MNINEQANLKPERILLLEDDLIIQRIHSFYLEELGYSYDVAKTVKEAIALYNKNKYGLMILDKWLPDMDSTYLCELVRSEYSKAELPIFMITACGYTAENECLQAGCNEFFVKPLDKEDFCKVVNRWMQTSKLALANRHSLTNSKRRIEDADLDETGG